ncbi:MAG: pilus assembly protein PilP [Betaproteobacteria bacterium RBG_16_56_24]|nr:MAG: pilus assembly protein PilP [Betaproteobacteria bacterium RBG_16_56_24]
MRFVHFLLVSLLLTGCGGEEFQDLRDFVKNSGKDMRGKIPPPPEVKLYEPFVYNNDASLPDPFKPRKPDLRSGRGGINQPDLERPKEALEEFPLENLRMAGYLFQNKVGYAVIRAPDGKLHRVKAGNYIGLNFGLIKEVTETEIIVKEVVQDSAGDWTDRESSLQLLE